MSDTVTVAPARFVTIRLYALISGHTEKAIRRKMERGVWLEGKHWRRADGVIYIDTKATERWVEAAAG
ncbi:excisionase [Acidovorax temperans]|uniref:Excisionase n=1 Tax=Acidovorax temperans TaxID=80878 RepID=A0A0D7KBD6_9BURK|nr:excisionase [Acidovorax temperans]KJA11314.1 excisionase [Acidovorax temperans]